MLSVEREANNNGLTYEMMMEHAGKGLADEVERSYELLKEGGVLGLVGSGNNGGDTLVALAHLAGKEWPATAYIVKERPKDDPLIDRLLSNAGSVIQISTDPKFEKLEVAIRSHNIIMDGLLGTGIKLPLKGNIAKALTFVQGTLDRMPKKPKVVAVDCPSGVDCGSGEVAPESLEADMTVTMAAIKTGLLKFPANNLLGELKLVGIGLDDQDKRSKTWQSLKREVADAMWVRQTLPDRPRDSHKGTFGTALIVAGSVNYTGAALLAGKGAYLAGVGLVTLAIPAPLHNTLAGHFPEGTWLILPHEMGVIDESATEIVLENLGRATAMLLGPGFGLEDETEKFMANLLATSPQSHRPKIGFVTTEIEEVKEEKLSLPPMVIDADGLKLLKRVPDWPEKLPEIAVLTPHPGEMAVLTGLSIKEIQANRIDITEHYAAKWGHVVMLKGANTVVAEPNGRTVVIPVASPALARAGTGDVLAGIIVGLRAQGLEAFEAAVSGGWIHAQSGLRAAYSKGSTASVLASDLLEGMVKVMADLYSPLL
jgi:hydroxyethylthiazole kinase-like uncharacterized protein yjeF